ncbi:MAG TPA: hypothetical protein VFR75_00940 [Solirubrobacterales bacterium]|nr:hypothetical protein [Solirubrobacterales bacterium]
MSTRISFNAVTLPDETDLPDEQLKNLVAELPEGFIGNPLATERCTGADFANISKETFLPACSNDAVVGVVNVTATLAPRPPTDPGVGAYVPVYNLEPGPGEVAKFGFAYVNVPITIGARLSERSPQEDSPYRVIASVTNTSQVVQLFGTELILWGNPSSSVHDPYRGTCLNLNESVGKLVSNGDCPTTLEEPPVFLTMPRSCTGALESQFTVSSWESPGVEAVKSALTFDETVPPGLTGCDELEFSPEVSLAPTGTAGDSPSGIAFDLDVDNSGLLSTAPGARAQSDIKRAVVTLPDGVTVNPSLAGGLDACTSAQIAQETASSPFGAGCPSASKIGSVEVETPLLDRKLTGSVFAAKQQDNPFGSLLALYVVIKSPELGVAVSLAGRVDTDPSTGQIVSTFDDLPQIPFSHFQLRFKEGPRAPLITPTRCGEYQTKVELTPWANPQETLTRTTTFEVTNGPGGGPCVSGRSFSPSLDAGTLNPLAGAYSPFVLRLQREDGSQRFAGLDLDLPKGLVGKLAGIPYCADATLASIAAQDQPGQGAAQIASPSCPAASQVGTATVGAGAGSSPVYIDTGRVYLAGPYKGAPLSVAIVTPAVTGPFDLGNVVVRAALYVDPSTAQIHTVSDPIPTILHGIPLDIRDIQVAMNRPDFILNPTSCEAMSFAGKAVSDEGAQAAVTDRFQVGSCDALGFKPKLSLALRGKTKRTGHPAVKAVLRATPGQANIANTVVMLPPSQFIDNARIGNPCTRPQFAEDKCPPKSLLGRARAFSPLLDQPLEGPVWFRSNGGERELPDMVVDLRGQIRVTLVGFIDSVKKKGSERSRLRTTFATVPDAPVSKFELSLLGGKKGLLVNSENLCARPRFASVSMDGQNGKANDSRVMIKTRCPKKKKKQGR